MENFKMNESSDFPSETGIEIVIETEKESKIDFFCKKSRNE